MQTLMAERPYIATRNAQIIRLLKKLAPKDIVEKMNLTSVSVVYAAVWKSKRRKRG